MPAGAQVEAQGTFVEPLTEQHCWDCVGEVGGFDEPREALKVTVSRRVQQRDDPRKRGSPDALGDEGIQDLGAVMLLSHYGGDVPGGIPAAFLLFADGAQDAGGGGERGSIERVKPLLGDH
jgi:hypothetical protein